MGPPHDLILWLTEEGREKQKGGEERERKDTMATATRNGEWEERKGRKLSQEAHLATIEQKLHKKNGGNNSYRIHRKIFRSQK